MFETTYTIDESNKTVTAIREFGAPLEKVWQAWTTQEGLEQWWAPEPWKAVTMDFSFSEGGRWHYYMSGPEGQKAWAVMIYKTIDPQKSFTTSDAFADEVGIVDPSMPQNEWRAEFESIGNNTKVSVVLTFITLDDLRKLISMGFKEGFAMAHQNLDRLLAK